MSLSEHLQHWHLLGPVIGLATFVVIGLFHPIVIKAEYYGGIGTRWYFLAAGLLFLAASVWVADPLWSSLLGVTAFSSFWSIREVIDQRKRVEKGWFPANPKRKNHKNSKS